VIFIPLLPEDQFLKGALEFREEFVHSFLGVDAEVRVFLQDVAIVDLRLLKVGEVWLIPEMYLKLDISPSGFQHF
jgi:hypothetical protein